MFRRLRAALVIVGVLAGVTFVRQASATTIALGTSNTLTGKVMLCDSVTSSCTPWGQPFDPIVGGVAIGDIDHDGQVEILALGASGPTLPPRLHINAVHPGGLAADIPLGNTPRGALLPSNIFGFGLYDDGLVHFAIGVTQPSAAFSVEIFRADGTWERTAQVPNVDDGGRPLTPLSFSVTHRDPADNGFVPLTGPNHAFAVLGYTFTFPGTPKVVVYGDGGGILRSEGIDVNLVDGSFTGGGFAAGDALSPTAGWLLLSLQTDFGSSGQDLLPPFIKAYSDPSSGPSSLITTGNLGARNMFLDGTTFFIAAAPECGKSVPPGSETALTDCDGVDNDCDGQIDEDFTPRRVGTFDPIRNQTVGGAAVPCERCTASTQCVGGRVIVPACASDCVPAPHPSDGGGWQFVVDVVDFDVGGGRLCFIPALSGSGVIGGLTCTTELVMGGDSISAPNNMTHVSLDAAGRAWATNFDGVNNGIWVELTGSLRSVPVDPNPCGAGVPLTALELVGPANQGLSGFLTSRPFVTCNERLFELNLANGLWIDHGLTLAGPNEGTHPDSLGASPSQGWDLFLKSDWPGVQTRALLELDQTSTIHERSALGLGNRTALVGGIFVIGSDYAPGLIGIDGGPCDTNGTVPCVQSLVEGSGDPGLFEQWDGTKLAPLSDLHAPLAVPNLADGKYARLSAVTTPIEPTQACVTSNDCTHGNSPCTNGFCVPDNPTPFRIAEGGKAGVAGPTKPGLTDIVWVLNNTHRLYVYLLPALSPALDGFTAPANAIYEADRGTNQPPIAGCRSATFAAGPSCTAHVEANAVNAGTSDPDGDPFALSLAPSGDLGLGAHAVVLTAFDDFGSSTCSATITVVDQTAPTLSAPPAVTATTCDVTALVSLGQPTASDNCATPTVTARVIASNGKTLASPIPVSGGQVTLGLGTHTVEWTASDGTNATKAQQTVKVLSAVQASQSFLVDDRAKLQTVSGGFAAVLNAGSGATRLGIDSHTGAIQSLGSVTSFDRAKVEGNLVTGGTYTPGTASVVTGTVTQHASVSFPAAPALPTFPTPSGSNQTVNSGSTYSPAPGSYPSLTVNSAATLVLAAGDYYFTTLVINGSATVRASATTRVFVRTQLNLGSSVKTSSGALAPIVLGFAGTTFSLGVPFTGALIAPNAALSIGSGSNLSFTGSFFAKTIELQPAVVLTCSTAASPAHAPPAPAEASVPPAAEPAGAAGCACTVSGTRETPWAGATVIVGLLVLRRSRRRPR